MREIFPNPTVKRKSQTLRRPHVEHLACGWLWSTSGCRALFDKFRPFRPECLASGYGVARSVIAIPEHFDSDTLIVMSSYYWRSAGVNRGRLAASIIHSPRAVDIGGAVCVCDYGRLSNYLHVVACLSPKHDEPIVAPIDCLNRGAADCNILGSS
jgi:hypothetical protein